MLTDPDDRKELSHYLRYAQIGTEMVAPAGVGAVLDYLLNWTPWGVIVGAALGLVAGLAHLVWMVGQDDPPPGPKEPPR